MDSGLRQRSLYRARLEGVKIAPRGSNFIGRVKFKTARTIRIESWVSLSELSPADLQVENHVLEVSYFERNPEGGWIPFRSNSSQTESKVLYIFPKDSPWI